MAMNGNSYIMALLIICHYVLSSDTFFKQNEQTNKKPQSDSNAKPSKQAYETHLSQTHTKNTHTVAKNSRQVNTFHMDHPAALHCYHMYNDSWSNTILLSYIFNALSNV